MKVPKVILEIIRIKANRTGGTGAAITLTTHDFDPKIQKIDLEALRGTLYRLGMTTDMPSWLGNDAITFKLSKRGKMLVESGRF